MGILGERGVLKMLIYGDLYDAITIEDEGEMVIIWKSLVIFLGCGGGSALLDFAAKSHFCNVNHPLYGAISAYIC